MCTNRVRSFSVECKTKHLYSAVRVTGINRLDPMKQREDASGKVQLGY